MTLDQTTQGPRLERRLEGRQIGNPRRSRIIESEFTREERIQRIEEQFARLHAQRPPRSERIRRRLGGRLYELARWWECR